MDKSEIKMYFDVTYIIELTSDIEIQASSATFGSRSTT